MPSPTLRVVRLVTNGSVTRATISALIPLAVIFHAHLQPVGRVVFFDDDTDRIGFRGYRVFGDIQKVQRQLSQACLLFLFLNGADQLRQLVRANPAVAVFVNDDHRRLAASAHAAADFQGDLAIFGRLAGLNAQDLLGLFDQLIRAAHVAGGAHAEFNRVLAARPWW